MSGKSQRGDVADRNRHGADYEVADIDPKAAGLTIAILAAILLATCAATAGLFQIFGNLREATPPRPPVSAAPPLQVNEAAERLAIEQRARTRLAGANGGVPIARAMQQTVAAGWDHPR